MKILYLDIPHESFSQLISGKFANEWRQKCPSDDRRYVESHAMGSHPEEKEEEAVPILYDAIRFNVNEEGYQGSVLIKIEKIDAGGKKREKELLSQLQKKGVKAFREIIFRLGNIIHKQIRIRPSGI